MTRPLGLVSVRRVWHRIAYKPTELYVRGELAAVKARLGGLKREPWTVAWAGCFSSTDTVYEIGANIGVFSLLFGLQAGRVYAFEPSRFAYEELVANLAHNRASNVVPVQAAVTDRSGTVTFNYASERPSGSLHSIGDKPLPLQPGGSPVLREDVRAITLDDFAAAHAPPDHLYIDTDGHEVEALTGAGRGLAGCRSVLCEFLTEAHYAAAESLLERARLRPLVRFDRVKPGREIGHFQMLLAREPAHYRAVLEIPEQVDKWTREIYPLQHN